MLTKYLQLKKIEEKLLTISQLIIQKILRVNPSDRMNKTLKVKRLIEQNGIQVDNFTMVIRLKKIIQQLKCKLFQQDQLIMQLKRDRRTTKINQMQVEIQHLNDQNKRLTLMIEEIKIKYKSEVNAMKLCLIGENSNKEFLLTSQSNKTNMSKRRKKSPHSKNLSSLISGGCTPGYTSSMMLNKKSYTQAQRQKQQLQKQHNKQKKFQRKYYQLLEQTQILKKQLINLRLKQPQSLKQRKSVNNTFIDKSINILLEKNIECLERMTQKKLDLEVENDILKEKLTNAEKKVKEVEQENQRGKITIEQLKNQLKCKSSLNSDNNLSLYKSSTLLNDLSNHNNKLSQQHKTGHLLNRCN